MQRQSLGSPGPKPLISGAAGGAAREEKRKTVDRAAGCATAAVNEENKLIRASPKAARWIHLIPVLTILCLLVLYLFSHELPLQGVSSAEIGAEKSGVASLTHQSGRTRGLKTTAGRLRDRKLGGRSFNF
ncbi:hypothetical protein Cni_G28329 [Canna indica]|uniref:Uncharacterized protein n=1 Tax=Canna indica TaxID=4628 RepID=A0AAQ3QS87_9LILI|nr:hypothetical protein Cni_G28329 [Canna indica]